MSGQELIRKAERLRASLEIALKEGRRNTPTYWKAYRKWFALREEGVRRKLFSFFTPTERDTA